MTTRNGVLWLIRGASGSGKTHLATIIEAAFPGRAIAISADNFRYDALGKYVYDPARNAEMAARCLAAVSAHMSPDRGYGNPSSGKPQWQHVIVHNTFTRRYELDPYYKLAEEFNYGISEIVCNNRFPNVHGVPDEAVDAQWARFEL